MLNALPDETLRALDILLHQNTSILLMMAFTWAANSSLHCLSSSFSFALPLQLKILKFPLSDKMFTNQKKSCFWRADDRLADSERISEMVCPRKTHTLIQGESRQWKVFIFLGCICYMAKNNNTHHLLCVCVFSHSNTLDFALFNVICSFGCQSLQQIQRVSSKTHIPWYNNWTSPTIHSIILAMFIV